MAASSKLMIGEAERRFPVRIRVAIPRDDIGRLADIHVLLDQNCGADGWAMTPQGCAAWLTTRWQSISPIRRLRAASWRGSALGGHDTGRFPISGR